jgi:hypothetical protein
MAFIPGLQLARRFFHDCVAPKLERFIPGVPYSAALIGDGSEVLGYDTAISTDHDWGPRVQIFVRAEDFEKAALTVIPVLDQVLPSRFLGWPVKFPDNGRPGGVDAKAGAAGSPAHGVEMHILGGWIEQYLGVPVCPPRDVTPLDWLSVPEPRLLSVTRGEVFRDDLGELTALRRQLGWFPRDVWLFKLASQWARISEEIAFVGRAGDIGDDLGSRLIAARLVHESMRLAFLIERRYAPYAKWFGVGFSELECAGQLGPLLVRVLDAVDWRDREQALGHAMISLVELHRRLDIPGEFSTAVSPYFGRPYQVINASEIAAGIFGAIQNTAILALPRIGAVDQFVDNTAVLTMPERARAIAEASFTSR